MLVQILSIVTPVFGLVLVGWLYARRHGPDMTAANRINLDVFTPALIFHVLSGRDFHIAEYADLALAAAGVVLGSGLIAAGVSRLRRIDWRTLVPPAMFNNSGNMGLPLAVLAFGDAALAAAVVVFLVENLLHFTLGLRMLDREASLLGLLRMPLVVACLAGIGVSLLGLEVPEPLAVSVGLLGQVSIPLMLFALGVRLRDADWTHWRIGVLGALLRPAAGLVSAFAVLALLPLDDTLARQLVLFAVLPPAVLNYVIAEQYRQEPHAVAAIVIWGNLGALITIPLTLALILP